MTLLLYLNKFRLSTNRSLLEYYHLFDTCQHNILKDLELAGTNNETILSAAVQSFLLYLLSLEQEETIRRLSVNPDNYLSFTCILLIFIGINNLKKIFILFFIFFEKNCFIS